MWFTPWCKWFKLGLWIVKSWEWDSFPTHATTCTFPKLDFFLGQFYLSVCACSSLFYDEDGDLAHEFYEETVVTKNGRKKSKLKRIQKNLIPQVGLTVSHFAWLVDGVPKKKTDSPMTVLLLSNFQGIVKLDHPCIHVDFPIILCEVWYFARDWSPLQCSHRCLSHSRVPVSRLQSHGTKIGDQRNNCCVKPIHWENVIHLYTTIVKGCPVERKEEKKKNPNSCFDIHIHRNGTGFH